VLRDVSEHKRRERELRRKERRYQAVFEDPNILVGLLDPDGTLLEVNETALEYVDADREAVVGEPFPETPWFAGDDPLRKRVEGWIDRAAAGEYVEFEADLSEAVRGDLIVEGVVRPVTDDDGEVVALLISDRDVTHRRERERELEVKTRAMDAAPIGIVLTDPHPEDNPLVDVNERFEKLTGSPEIEAVGRNCRFLQGEATEAEPIAELRRAIDREVPTTVELRNYRRDGEAFWNEVTVAPIENDAGEVTHYVGFQRDVSDRKDHERRLERQNEQFDELAEIVSHDLRTPAETVRGRLELARGTGDPEHVADALTALERVDELRRELVDVLRRRGVLEGSDRVDVARLARSVWAARSPPADASLRAADPARMDANRQALRRLSENLIGNPLEHGGDGVRVRIGPLRGRPRLLPRGRWPRRPPEDREAVFEPGFPRKDEEGVGVGLAIVRRIADAHGWTVAAGDSDELGGVRFEVRAS